MATLKVLRNRQHRGCPLRAISSREPSLPSYPDRTGESDHRPRAKSSLWQFSKMSQFSRHAPLKLGLVTNLIQVVVLSPVTDSLGRRHVQRPIADIRPLLFVSVGSSRDCEGGDISATLLGDEFSGCEMNWEKQEITKQTNVAKMYRLSTRHGKSKDFRD